jgi:hypothetical protein
MGLERELEQSQEQEWKLKMGRVRAHGRLDQG